MLRPIKNILSDILLRIRNGIERRQLETLSQYWEFVLQETQYKNSKYKLLTPIRISSSNDYATQFVQDRTNLTHYTLRIPKSELYNEIKEMYLSISANSENVELLDEYSELLRNINQWLLKLESQYDYSFAKPYNAMHAL